MTIRSLFTLPYGYQVKTSVLSRSRFIRAGGGTEDFAFWCSSRQTIYLRADRLPTERWEDYLHELEHMWVDYREYLRHLAAAKIS